MTDKNENENDNNNDQPKEKDILELISDVASEIKLLYKNINDQLDVIDKYKRKI